MSAKAVCYSGFCMYAHFFLSVGDKKKGIGASQTEKSSPRGRISRYKTKETKIEFVM